MSKTDLISYTVGSFCKFREKTTMATVHKQIHLFIEGLE